VSNLHIDVFGANNSTASGVELDRVVNSHISDAYVVCTGGTNTQIGWNLNGGADSTLDSVLTNVQGINCGTAFKLTAANNIAFIGGQNLSGSVPNNICFDIVSGNGNVFVNPDCEGFSIGVRAQTGATQNLGSFYIGGNSVDFKFLAGSQSNYFMVGGGINGTNPVVSDSGTNNSVINPNTFKQDSSSNLTLGGNLVATAIQPNGVSVVNAGVPALVAKANATAQAANIGSTTLYAVPASGAGMYRVSGYIVITQGATVSSTMPSLSVGWTDNDSGVTTSGVFTSTTTSNAAGFDSSDLQGSPGTGIFAVGSSIINAKASTNITYSTNGYASAGATPMQYALHVKLEYLGN
jgi:hypothetical protein